MIVEEEEETLDSNEIESVENLDQGEVVIIQGEEVFDTEAWLENMDDVDEDLLEKIKNEDNPLIWEYYLKEKYLIPQITHLDSFGRMIISYSSQANNDTLDTYFNSTKESRR